MKIKQQALILFFLTTVLFQTLSAQTVKGVIKDVQSGEALVGASILVKGESNRGAVAGLDGSFAITGIAKFPATIVCNYLGYKAQEVVVSGAAPVTVLLEPAVAELGEVVIRGKNYGSTEADVRKIEQTSMNVVNIVSAKAIDLSPDMTVANVAQRVSGVTIERNSSGDGQYALLRGMDKRFSYTLVNGIKIPSPDNKNRFVPLDIFPSELLDRLEITKSLDANMEGDGIGGAVNMVMKDAPPQWQFTANLSTGYNAQFLSRDYRSFDYSAIDKSSPNERYGLGYPVKIKDFNVQNMKLRSSSAPANVAGGFSAGNRFFGRRLGIILAGSYTNAYRGNTSDIYAFATTAGGQQSITNRYFSNQQTRTGMHLKFDYNLSNNHKLMWYNAYMDFRNAQVRDAFAVNSQTTRLRWNHQTIFSSTLKGVHNFAHDKLDIDWSLSFGEAFNETPDNVQLNMLVINDRVSIDQNSGATRRWEHNSDNDKAAYLNLLYHFMPEGKSQLDVSAGGMYRDKVRSSYFNEYEFKPFDPLKPNPRELILGTDWEDFTQVTFSVREYGNLSDPLNYDASEKVAAGYVQAKYTSGKLQLTGGMRMEHTRQGYDLKFPVEGAQNKGAQDYVDNLTSLHAKYLLHRNANLRLSWVKAINRPSFFEIVPYNIINEDYKERGNPDLKHTVADNIDLRYEYFPRSTEQLMAGLFYKRIKDPIEFGMMSGFGQDTYYMPMNFGEAFNYGAEIDFIKYFRSLGVKVNYTFTSSRITTTKMKVLPNPDPNAETNYITEYVDQTRPLYGQAMHTANFSLLFKDERRGWNAQLAFSYTGDRLCIVSRYLNEDIWQAGYTQADASVEKRFAGGLVLFAKASNLFNSPMIQYLPDSYGNAYDGMERYRNGVVERKEYYGQNMTAGVKWKF